jgi:parvulin-like peptidyl-prolyl isomerase
MMAKAFGVALDKLAVGKITPEPVETPFGFHVIRKDDMKAKEAGVEKKAK